MSTDRRSFLKQAAAALAVTSVIPGLPEFTRWDAQGTPDARVLTALGDATLPESLGADGRARAVEAFRDWLAAFRTGAERTHGYGNAAITYNAADPRPGWNAQLAALDAAAREKFGSGFAALPIEKRRIVLSTPLDGARLPASPLAASHVAVALLAHWASSSEAVDLAYRARIRTQSCRRLSDNPRKPLPLSSG